MFISLEGIDGSGKTTQARLLAAALEGEPLLVREPGGTPAGERVRELLTDPAIELEPMTELMLFLAARAQLCERVLRPALAEGRTVICDRFTDSTVAYQGEGRDLGAERVRDLCEIATGGLRPALTLLFDVDPELAAGRRSARRSDRFELEGDELQRRVAAAYARIAQAEPERVRVIDGQGRPAEVHDRALAAVREAASLSGAGGAA